MSIKAYYRFNGNSNDHSGNGYNGTDANTSYQNNDILVMDGSTSTIDVTQPILYGNKTISAYLYFNVVNAYQCIWTQYRIISDSDYQDISFTLTDTGKLYFNEQNVNINNIQSDLSLTANKWYH